MGLFDKLKDIKMKDIKEMVVGTPMPEKPIMKITMMGARGVGKTSVLTSMYHDMNAAINDTALHMNAEIGTELILQNKVDDLKRMFYNGNSINDVVSSGISGDSTVSIFNFDFGLNTEKINMGLEIRDFPGEFVRDDPETVKQFIEESNAVIVAIDTPHLMECDGKYNEGKNYTSVLTKFFKDTLNAQSSEKLIMLVPLKCEKYYHEGRIEEVTAKVSESYRELISFLKDKGNVNGFEKRFACVITPIQTVGEIVFDGFEAKDGVVEEFIYNGNAIPKKVNYKYLKAGAVYSPKHCEQPLYYLLSFVAKQYMEMKDHAKNDNLLGKFMKLFSVSPAVSEMMYVLQGFTTKKLDKADGFKVCFGRGKV